MFGYTADEMVGQSILRLVPADLHYEEDEILRKLRAGERIHHYANDAVQEEWREASRFGNHLAYQG
jgi:PAS domain S-box-containing protein